MRIYRMAVFMAICIPTLLNAQEEANLRGAKSDLLSAGQKKYESVRVLVDFSNPNEGRRWETVNDNVMGGRSRGGPRFGESTLVFQGTTNTNGGGFSSIRTRPQAWKTADAAGLVVRVRGDGRTYKADLRTDNRIGRMAIAYRADFMTVANKWIEVTIPFDNFKPSLYGSNMEGRTAALDHAKIETLGFMIYDKKDGEFRLEVDWIQAYR